MPFRYVTVPLLVRILTTYAKRFKPNHKQGGNINYTLSIPATYILYIIYIHTYTCIHIYARYIFIVGKFFLDKLKKVLALYGKSVFKLV